MNPREIRFPLAVVEGMHLAGLVDDLITVIASADDAGYTADPAVARLTPDPYPDDDTASADFMTATRDDLLQRRIADAMTVRSGLDAFIDREGSSLEQIDVLIPHTEIDSWLRTLTALRLVIASRLGIVADAPDHDPADSRYGVYDWLAFRLDGLVAVADALDDIPDGL